MQDAQDFVRNSSGGRRTVVDGLRLLHAPAQQDTENEDQGEGAEVQSLAAGHDHQEVSPA